MSGPKAIIFDVDDTLAESFQPPKPSMISLLLRLLEKRPIALMTGAGFERVAHDFLEHLELSPHIARLYVLPNSATQAYIWQDGWNEEYNHSMSEEERSFIRSMLSRAEESLPLIQETKAYGQRVADREAQIAYTVVGLDAPQDAKMAWDPDAAKRREILKFLQPLLPDYDIKTGGASTIDITKKGINKAYGVRWLSERLGIEPREMLYVGDALHEGGNDSVVIPTGIQTRLVSGPEETIRVIESILS